jgi:hypothetical protein
LILFSFPDTGGVNHEVIFSVQPERLIHNIIVEGAYAAGPAAN